MTINQYGHLLCPTCGFDYTHLRAVSAHQATDSGRQDVELVFECEEGHFFEVTFHQHKGQTEVSSEGVNR